MPRNKALIEAQVELLLMHEEKGFEDLVLKNTTEEALKRFAKLIDWPPHLTAKYPDLEAQAAGAVRRIISAGRRETGASPISSPSAARTRFLSGFVKACLKLKAACTPAPAPLGGCARRCGRRCRTGE